MPLCLYIYCNSCYVPKLQLIREKLWQWLIKIDYKTVYVLIGWIQVNTNHLEVICSLIYDTLDDTYFNVLSSLHKDSLIFLSILLIDKCTRNNINCTLILKRVMKRISQTSSQYHNPSLIILSNTILNCSIGDLEDIIKLCVPLGSIILKRKQISPIIYSILQSSIIIWNSNRCSLIEQHINYAEEILYQLEQYVEESDIFSSNSNSLSLDYLVMCNPDLVFYNCLFKHLNDKQWLNKLADIPLYLLNKMISVLFGLFCSKALNFEEKDKVLSLIIKCTDEYNTNLYPAVLTLILYNLANTTDNLLIIKLMKTLPLMAKFKENRLKVITTLKIMTNNHGNTRNALVNYATDLLYKIWEIDYKCYSHLENLLYLSSKSSENEIFKSFLLKKLAENGPEVHGNELVKQFSNIINTCNESISISNAIDGIRFLCCSGVIDIFTTFDELKLKFEKEHRILVIKSICTFLEEIPTIPETEHSEILYEKCVKLLCHWIQMNNNNQVGEYALNALTFYDIKMIKDNLINYFPVEDTDKNNTQGWFKFMFECKPKKSVTNFMTKMIGKEIDNLLRHIYKKKKEPENYGYLPTGSLIAMMGKYLKNNVNNLLTKWKNTKDEQIYIQCLEILGQKYNKPLPPFNWFFLQELIHESNLTELCINLVSHQVTLSGSARNIVENYIVASSMSKATNPFPIYNNLKYIANSIQPVSLNPFIKSTLIPFIENDSTDDNQLINILQSLKDVLANTTIQDVNKNEIETILIDIILKDNIPKQRFDLILECINSFSDGHKEYIASYNSKDFNQKEFDIILNIRCLLANDLKQKNPLNWLNPIFELGWKFNRKHNEYINKINECIIKNHQHPYLQIWLYNFLEEIEYMTVNKTNNSIIDYYFSIFVSNIIYASGFHIFINENNDDDDHQILFPVAITSLVDQFQYSNFTNKVLDCLHILTNQLSSDSLKSIAAITMCCLRHQEEFNKTEIELKYLECYTYLSSKFNLCEYM